MLALYCSIYIEEEEEGDNNNNVIYTNLDLVGGKRSSFSSIIAARKLTEFAIIFRLDEMKQIKKIMISYLYISI